MAEEVKGQEAKKFRDGLLHFMGLGFKDDRTTRVALFELSGPPSASSAFAAAAAHIAEDRSDDMRSKRLAHEAGVAIRSRNMTSWTLKQIKEKIANYEQDAAQLPLTLVELKKAKFALENYRPKEVQGVVQREQRG
jgi:hypothetical protein